MFSLMGTGQNLLDTKAVYEHYKCLRRANYIGVAAPIAPMVSYAYVYSTYYGTVYIGV